MDRVYEAVSAVLSAPLIAIYMTVFFSLFSPVSLGAMTSTESIISGLLFLMVLPISIIFLFAKKHSIEIDIVDREKRTPVFILTIANYIIGALVFWLFNNHVMFLFSLSYVVVTSFVMVVNLFWKISVHAAGFSGPLTALYYVFGPSFSVLFIFLFPLLYSRYKLGHHTKLQLLAGTIASIFITYFVYFIWW